MLCRWGGSPISNIISLKNGGDRLLRRTNVGKTPTNSLERKTHTSQYLNIFFHFQCNVCMLLHHRHKKGKRLRQRQGQRQRRRHYSRYSLTGQELCCKDLIWTKYWVSKNVFFTVWRSSKFQILLSPSWYIL